MSRLTWDAAGVHNEGPDGGMCCCRGTSCATQSYDFLQAAAQMSAINLLPACCFVVMQGAGCVAQALSWPPAGVQVCP